jgi:hypothetical protein
MEYTYEVIRKYITILRLNERSKVITQTKMTEEITVIIVIIRLYIRTKIKKTFDMNLHSILTGPGYTITTLAQLFM